MHLLRSVITLAALVAPLATALLNLPLRDIIDHDQLPEFIALESLAANHDFEHRPIYYQGVIIIRVYNRSGVFQYSQFFLANEKAAQYSFPSTSGPSGDGQRGPRTGGKAGKSGKAVESGKARKAGRAGKVRTGSRR